MEEEIKVTLTKEQASEIISKLNYDISTYQQCRPDLKQIVTKLESSITKANKPKSKLFVSFELTMPNVGSWNGKWSGSDKKYYVIKTISRKFLESNDYFKSLLEKKTDSWFYNFGDGWGANIEAKIINSQEARTRKKISKGFCGYEWMIESIMNKGTINHLNTKL